jgi:RNA 2',3'-cyclic 3'-phosphodiesterase
LAPARVPALTDALAGVLAPAEVHLRLAGAGTFPARGDPRVLWVGVDGDVEQLAVLADAAADAGRSVGIDVDRRAYRPHVTVGRWPFSAHGDRKIANALGNYAGPHFTAGEVVLMRSHHGAAPRYETVAAWGGAPGDTVGTHHPTPR